jgi:hypothetical protein
VNIIALVKFHVDLVTGFDIKAPIFWVQLLHSFYLLGRKINCHYRHQVSQPCQHGSTAAAISLIRSFDL